MSKRKAEKMAPTSAASTMELESLIAALKSGAKPVEIELRTFEFMDVNVRIIREALGMSRQQFAMTYGLSFRTVENWEDGRRQPDGPALSYMVAIAFAPRAVAQAIKDYHDGKLPSVNSFPSRSLPFGGKTPIKKNRAVRTRAGRTGAALKHA